MLVKSPVGLQHAGLRGAELCDHRVGEALGGGMLAGSLANRINIVGATSPSLKPEAASRCSMRRKLQGHYAYYGMSFNSEALGRFHYLVEHEWHKWLSRRSGAARRTCTIDNLIGSAREEALYLAHVFREPRSRIRAARMRSPCTRRWLHSRCSTGTRRSFPSASTAEHHPTGSRRPPDKQRSAARRRRRVGCCWYSRQDTERRAV
jgi:hypothetical protein